MEKVMNIQIFGKSKCFDTKKAERYFKERKIKYQLINMTEKGMSKGEYNSVKQAVGDSFADYASKRATSGGKNRLRETKCREELSLCFASDAGNQREPQPGGQRARGMTVQGVRT